MEQPHCGSLVVHPEEEWLFTLVLYFSVQQWEFQVGPAIGISAADQLWAARYILEVHVHTFMKFLSRSALGIVMGIL